MMPSPPVPPAVRQNHDERLTQQALALRSAFEREVRAVAPLVLELGSGHGHFLTAYATAHPQHTCVGVDFSSDRVARAIRKRNRARLGNLHFLHGEAGMLVSTLPAGIRIVAIFVLFPDPWPKRRHHKNRLIQPAFLDALAARVGEGTRLYFRTDHEEYFNAARATISAHKSWHIVPGTWPFEHITVFQARAELYHSLVAAPRGALGAMFYRLSS